MSIPPTPVASGVPYRVVAVNGHDHVSLADLDGDATVTVSAGAGELHELEGRLARTDLGVSFYEKGHTLTGKDVRVWVLADDGDGVTATAQARF